MFLFGSTVWADNNPICVRLKRKECAVKTTFYMSSGGGDTNITEQ